MKTIFVVLALALVAQAKPARSLYGGPIIFNPFRDESELNAYSQDESIRREQPSPPPAIPVPPSHSMEDGPIIFNPFRDESEIDAYTQDESESAPDYSSELPAPSPFQPTAPFPPSVGGSYSLNSMLDGIFKRMREQLDRLPTLHAPNFQSFGFPSFADPNEPFTNSSSSSTVVGDHVVTVNETVYHKDDGGTKSVFRIKVIDFSPKKEVVAEKKPTTEDTKTEGSVEEIIEVDLPSEKGEKAPEVTTFESTESTDQDMDNEIPSQNQETLLDTIKRWNEHKQIERSAAHEDVEFIPGAETPIDLTGDLKVNQILQDQAMKGGLFMPDPDAEFIEVDDQGRLVPNNLQELD